MRKVTIYGGAMADNYFEDVALEAEKRGFIRFNSDLNDYSLVTSWSDVDELREEMHRQREQLGS